MPQTRQEISTDLAEHLCWQVARRDDACGAAPVPQAGRRGVCRLDEGALLDDVFSFLPELGVQVFLCTVKPGNLAAAGIQSLPRDDLTMLLDDPKNELT